MEVNGTVQDSKFIGAIARQVLPASHSDLFPRPFLKWVGGKSQVIEEIRKRLPAPEDYRRYFEPFLGGGAVYFRIIPSEKEAILSDINENLIGAFKDVQQDLANLISRLSTIEKQFREIKKGSEKQRKFYYEKRAEYNQLRTPGMSTQRTALLIFLNKACYNGVYRENLKGEFNVPIGRNNLNTLLNNQNIELVSEKLKNAKLIVGNYQFILNSAKTKDLIYLDPPYDPISDTANFTKYHRSGFGKEHQVELRRVFEILDKRGCYVIMSNSNTSLIRDLYKKYSSKVERIRVARNINCMGSLRKSVEEVLIKNY